MEIRVKRIYDPVEANDGKRILVDRIWPRNVKKDTARIDRWLKEIAPSSELRRWFGHDPARWETFCDRYQTELDNRPEQIDELLQDAFEGTVTLVYAAKDRTHNNAVCLKQYLDNRLSRLRTEKNGRRSS